MIQYCRNRGCALLCRNTSSRTDGIDYLVGQESLTSNIPLLGNNYPGVVADFINIHNTGFVTSANYSGLANRRPLSGD